MISIYIKGKVLLTTKDLIFIIASSFLFGTGVRFFFSYDEYLGLRLIIPAIILQIIYAIKLIENYNKQENQKSVSSYAKLNDKRMRTASVPKSKFYEA